MLHFYFRQVICLGLLTTFLLLSCVSEPKKRPSTNSKGHRYTYHQLSEGRQAKAGEHILYHVYQRADDSLINSSRQRPVQPRLVVPDSTRALELRNPINEALLRMAIGDSLTISIPMTEVPQRPEGFKDYQYLHFDLIVTGIQSAEDFRQQLEQERQKANNRRSANQSRKSIVENQLTATIAAYHNRSLKDTLIKKTSGLKYCVHVKGSGALPKPGDLIQVHFYSMLPNGKMLTHNFDETRPYQFYLGEGSVIPAWEEAMAELPPGSRATLFVPPDLAYGEAGQPPAIPAKTELVYYVEILKKE